MRYGKIIKKNKKDVVEKVFLYKPSAEKMKKEGIIEIPENTCAGCIKQDDGSFVKPTPVYTDKELRDLIYIHAESLYKSGGKFINQNFRVTANTIGNLTEIAESFNNGDVGNAGYHYINSQNHIYFKNKKEVELLIETIKRQKALIFSASAKMSENKPIKKYKISKLWPKPWEIK